MYNGDDSPLTNVLENSENDVCKPLDKVLTCIRYTHSFFFFSGRFTIMITTIVQIIMTVIPFFFPPITQVNEVH